MQISKFPFADRVKAARKLYSVLSRPQKTALALYGLSVLLGDCHVLERKLDLEAVRKRVEAIKE